MEFTTLATGYCFLEAPRADGDSVWFTDLLLGGLYRWSPGREVERFLPENQHIGGVALNEGGAVICGGLGGLRWFDSATGRTGMLLEEVGGKPLAGVNDMLPDGKGGLYFGTLSTAGTETDKAEPNRLCRLDPDGRATVVAEGLKIANGIGLSPDGTRLYHNESLVGTFAYNVRPDGSLGQKELLCERTDGDGMAVDCEGRLWIASFSEGEIYRLLPDGTLDCRIEVPHKVVASLCFGGPDWRDLYVVTAGDEGVLAMLRDEQPPREASLLHARADVAGLPVAKTRFRLPEE